MDKYSSVLWTAPIPLIPLLQKEGCPQRHACASQRLLQKKEYAQTWVLIFFFNLSRFKIKKKMKNYLTNSILFIFLMTFSQLAYSQEELEFDKVVSTINTSLEEAQAKLSNVRLKSASVSLSVTKNKEGGGGFKIFGKGKAKWSKENTSSITLNYIEIKSNKQKSLTTSTLTQLIIEAAKAYKETRNITGLQKDNFIVDLSIAISKSAGGGVEFELFGIGFDASGEKGKSAVHKITLVFTDKI